MNPGVSSQLKGRSRSLAMIWVSLTLSLSWHRSTAKKKLPWTASSGSASQDAPLLHLIILTGPLTHVRRADFPEFVNMLLEKIRVTLLGIETKRNHDKLYQCLPFRLFKNLALYFLIFLLLWQEDELRSLLIGRISSTLVLNSERSSYIVEHANLNSLCNPGCLWICDLRVSASRVAGISGLCQ